MKREEAEEGMKIVFRGRNAEGATIGEIIKLNPARAKVRVIESQLDMKIGSIWNVPYLLMEPAAGKSGFGTGNHEGA